MPTLKQDGNNNEHIQLFYVINRISKPVSMSLNPMKNKRTTAVFFSKLILKNIELKD